MAEKIVNANIKAADVDIENSSQSFFWVENDGETLYVDKDGVVVVASDNELVGQQIEIETDEEETTQIDSLLPVDHFAMTAISALIDKLKDPLTLSDLQMTYYCEKAYKWAKAMMVVAGKYRAENVQEEEPTPETPEEPAPEEPTEEVTQ